MNLFAVVLSQAKNLLVKLDALTGKATSLGTVADDDSPIQGIALGEVEGGAAPAMAAAERWVSGAGAPMPHTPTTLDASACPQVKRSTARGATLSP